MDRFSAALALVLEEETGYPQPVGGPYVRLHVTSALNDRRHKKGLLPLPLGVYVLDGDVLRCRETGAMLQLPEHPDGLAFDDHPQDPGGRTGMGILQREYSAWRSAQKLPDRDVWAISDDELTALYRAKYWDACACDRLEPGVAEFTFNTAVNAGVGTAGTQLQRVAGVDLVDGRIGDVTITASVKLLALDVINDLAEMQEKRYRALGTFKVFGRNWLARNERVAEYCRRMAGDIDAVVVPIGDGAAPASRSARAHEDPPPETAAQSTTNQVATGVVAAGKALPVFKIATIAKGFAVTGKSVLSLEFLFEVGTDPEVWAFLIVGGGLVWGGLHLIGERTRRLLIKGD